MLTGIGAVGAARLLNEHGAIESFPPNIPGDQLATAMLFKQLATLRSEEKLFRDVNSLRWTGPTPSFAAWTERVGEPKLLKRALAVQATVQARP